MLYRVLIISRSVSASEYRCYFRSSSLTRSSLYKLSLSLLCRKKSFPCPSVGLIIKSTWKRSTEEPWIYFRTSKNPTYMRGTEKDEMGHIRHPELRNRKGLPRLGRSFAGWWEQMTGSWMYALPYRWGHLDEIYLKNYGNNYYFFWEKFPIWILPGNWRRSNSFEPMGSQLLLVQKSPHAKEAHPGEAYSEPLQNQTENNKIK